LLLVVLDVNPGGLWFPHCFPSSLLLYDSREREKEERRGEEEHQEGEEGLLALQLAQALMERCLQLCLPAWYLDAICVDVLF